MVIAFTDQSSSLLQTTAGYRFLIMEKMAASFDQVVQDIGTGKRSFGVVATHLINIIEAVHVRKLLVIDIKPDNFMISSSSQDIVMIDLGLVQAYGSMGGHRPNAGGGSVVGTPLYASLNLFNGDTPARRDDLEALCYMLMEIVLSLANKELPWSRGRSEEEIGALKRDAMESTDIWWTTGPVAIGKALQAFFINVRALPYSKKPDYDALRLLMKGLDISGTRKKRATTARTTTATRVTTRTTTTRTTRAAKKRPSPEKQTGRSSKKQEVVVINDDDDDEEDDFHSVQNEDDDFHSCIDDTMDWEIVQDAKPRAKQIGVTLEIVAGPHDGETLSLVKGERDTIVFGLRTEDGYDLAGDSDVDLEHVEITLQATKKLATVVVKDLRSSSGTYVNKTMIASGKSQKVFINDTITIGAETIIKVLPLVAMETRGAASVEVSNVPDVDMQEISSSDETKENATPSHQGVKLIFVEGPHENESLEILQGKSVVLGSQADFVVQGADDSHVKLTLQVSRQLVAVSVKDLRSSSGTFINGNKVRGEGKLFLGDLLKIGSSTMKVATKDEAAAKTTTKKSTVAPKKSTLVQPKVNARGFRVEFTEGPYKGEGIALQDTLVDTVVLGANPRPRSGQAFKLNKDSSITDASSVRLELDATKKGFCSVVVTDLKGTTNLNGKEIGKGKKQTAFCNDLIVVGASTLQIMPLL